TRFEEVSGEALQVVDEAGEFQLEEADLSGLADEERAAEVRRRVQEEAQQGFDLRTGPLFRATLLRLSDQEHVLQLTVHHIVSDGWSQGVLVRELSALYGAFARGEPSPLAALPIQYVDYALWQRGWLQGEVLEKPVRF